MYTISLINVLNINMQKIGSNIFGEGEDTKDEGKLHTIELYQT